MSGGVRREWEPPTARFDLAPGIGGGAAAQAQHEVRWSRAEAPPSSSILSAAPGPTGRFGDEKESRRPQEPGEGRHHCRWTVAASRSASAIWTRRQLGGPEKAPDGAASRDRLKARRGSRALARLHPPPPPRRFPGGATQEHSRLRGRLKSMRPDGPLVRTGQFRIARDILRMDVNRSAARESADRRFAMAGGDEVKAFSHLHSPQSGLPVRATGRDRTHWGWSRGALGAGVDLLQCAVILRAHGSPPERIWIAAGLHRFGNLSIEVDDLEDVLDRPPLSFTDSLAPCALRLFPFRSRKRASVWRLNMARRRSRWVRVVASIFAIRCWRPSIRCSSPADRKAGRSRRSTDSGSKRLLA